MKINKILPCSLCMLISAAVFAADNTDAVMMDASPCLDIVSPIERLACFEEQANAAQGRGTAIPRQDLPVVSVPRNSRQQPAQSSQQAPQQVEPQPAPETQQAVVQEAETARSQSADNFESDFGLPEERVDEEKARANELLATVAELKEQNRNRFIITLANGQVWEQMETKRFALDMEERRYELPQRVG